MCGILGVVPSVEVSAFRSALDLLAHRGPDGRGVWLDGAHAMLGHRRLAILDPTDVANQPMAYGDRYQIVFNGEIYNFLEIRRDLEAVGHKFRTASDTEVLLAAFAEWGSECLNRFNGMWAFALWDSDEKRLFLARDRVGKKPLFYVHDGSAFAFASEQKGLLPLMKAVKPSQRFAAMADSPYTYEASSECLFDGIKRFPAAHYGWLSNGILSLHRYWVPLQRRVDVPADYAGQVEVLRGMLFDSCRLRLRADVPIGTALSGGIDSSAVAACVAATGTTVVRSPKNWQSAFVAGFPGAVMDESDYAVRVAEHLGINLTRLTIEPERSVDRLDEWTFGLEEVHEVNPIPHILLYRQMRERGMVVSLDGHGGDELFCGYESSVLHALPDALPNLRRLREVLWTYRACHPMSDQFRAMSLPRIAGYLAKSKLRRLRTGGPSNRGGTRQPGSLNTHLLQLSFETVLPTLLRNYDRYSMISGVEVRMPLLDHRIVDFAFAIPWDSKVRNGYTKSILRDAVSPLLPEKIVRRHKKIGFAPPIRDWLRGPLREYVLDEVESESFRAAQLIQPAKLRATLTDILDGRTNPLLHDVERTWRDFNIYLWEKVFIQKPLWRRKLSE